MADIAYNPSFPDRAAVLTSDQKHRLEECSKRLSLKALSLDPETFEACVMACAYVSARTEGCRYTASQARDLLRYGITAKSLPREDTVMLSNVHEAILGVTSCTGRMPVLTKVFIRGIHGIISKDLLLPEFQGKARNFPVSIGGSGYRPLAGALPLDLELERILRITQGIADPFERCVHAHLNLAYLQYFADGNKRTARATQTAVLADADLPPLMLTEGEIPSYIDALVRYYETGDPEAYTELFCAAYEDGIAALAGNGDEASPRRVLLESMK